MAAKTVQGLEKRLSRRVLGRGAHPPQGSLFDRGAGPFQGAGRTREQAVTAEEQGRREARGDDLPGEGPTPCRDRLAPEMDVLGGQRRRKRPDAESDRAIRTQAVL